MSKITENGKMVINYCKDMVGVEDLTASDIANALGIKVQSVNGSINNLVNKGFAKRVTKLQKFSDGSTKEVKYIEVDESIKEFDPSATPTLVSEEIID